MMIVEHPGAVHDEVEPAVTSVNVSHQRGQRTAVADVELVVARLAAELAERGQRGADLARGEDPCALRLDRRPAW